MSNKTRSILKALAVILVLLSSAIALGWVSIPLINGYIFWMVVIAFGVLLISGR